MSVCKCNHISNFSTRLHARPQTHSGRSSAGRISMEPPHKRGHVSKCDHLQKVKGKTNKVATTLLLSIICSIFIAASHLANAEENGVTSVMGDLGLTLRAAAISWSRLTNSVMDRRSSGFTFNIEPEQQDKCDAIHVRNAGLWSPWSKEGFLYYHWSLRRGEHTYEVVVYYVFDVVLRNGIFPVDNLQFGSILERVLLKTQEVEDASEGLCRREVVKKALRETSGLQQMLKGWKSSDPDVLFLIDGEVGVEVDHLWGSIRRSGVSCDLHRTENMRR